jgi:hypothetical protein
MRSRIAILATALVLGTAIFAAAQIAVESSTGTIVRIDPRGSRRRPSGRSGRATTS